MATAPRSLRRSQRIDTLVDRLQANLLERPTDETYRFLVDGEGAAVGVTNADLDLRARTIAVTLRERVNAGDRALIVCPPGIDYVVSFLGCLYAGVIAVPVYPPGPRLRERELSRLAGVVANAAPKVALAPATTVSAAAGFAGIAPVLAGLSWQAVDELDHAVAGQWRRPAIGPDDVAFLQYTSGSTGDPRGVILSHANLLHNLEVTNQRFVKDPTTDHVVIWLPPYHDMGLIGGLLQPPYASIPVTFMSPLSFLKHPVRWLKAISDCGATLSGGPNFAYELCLSKVSDEDRQQLDLSTWRLAFVGAEPVRAATLERFSRVFATCGFRSSAFFPCYGLAEGTLLVTGGDRAAEPVVRRLQAEALQDGRAIDASAGDDLRTLVGCGQASAGHDVMIVDQERHVRLPDGQVGEIWASGPSNARGYWNDADKTREVFEAYLADTGEGPFLRTGDLGFLDDGELFVTGRRKDVIIAEGANHYPQDIEWSVEQCDPALRSGGGVACSIEVGDQERLIIVHELAGNAKKVDTERVMSAIRAAVATEHGLVVHQIALVPPGSVPKTSSGKVQRSACRDDLAAGRLQPIATWTLSPGGSTQPPAIQSALEYETGHAPVEDAPEVALGAEELARRVCEELAATAGLPVAEVDPRLPIASYGLRSVDMVGLAGEFERLLGRELPATLLWEYPTVEALVGYLTSPTSSPAASASLPVPAGDLHRSEPIAVIGIGCRLPGGVDGPQALWRLLCEGRDAITEVPPDRWRIEDFVDEDPSKPGKTTTRWGGFVGRVDQFDPHFFGISPREAARMDPQQRLLAEVTWEALEDAGVVAEHLAGTPTGVFIGIATNDYGHLQFLDLARIDAYTGTGNAMSIAANRLSYLFDLRGPSMAIDTACSSSLVAVHQAVESLARQECTLAIAGGVNLVLSPALAINFSKAGAMAPDGRCKAFDARADGYVRAEGAGIVVLKPLSQALADRDPIYGVILGSAVNQDGRTNGLMAPNPHAQEAVLRAAYARAGVRPHQVQYVEAHGTGTLLGDPIEAKALSAVIGTGRDARQPCLIGSVKSNLGHLEAAAGVAGMIKALLMVRHRLVPPSVHYQRPNPHIPFAELPLRVADSLQPWPSSDVPAVAGVSSFGFGGTNAHVVIQEPPVTASPAPASPSAGVAGTAGPAYVLPISARTEQALRDLGARYEALVEGQGSEVLLDRLCAAAAIRRTHHEHRLACVGVSPEEIRQALRAFSRGDPAPGLSWGVRGVGQRPRTAFVFSGQGPRWWPLAADLLDNEPVFRGVLERCDGLLRRYGADWSLLEQVTAAGEGSRLADPAVCQPALCALQVALATLWRSWGLEPATVVGHSVGEIAAAQVAGALSLEQAMRVAYRRGQVIRSAVGAGSMAVAGVTLDQARQLLTGVEDGLVSVAASNGPHTTVLSGDTATLRGIVASLEADGIFCRLLESVDFASHSPQMEPLQDELRRGLADLRPRAATIAMISTVTGGTVDGTDLDCGYWARNLREPVLFDQAMTALADAGYDTFIEISPHPMLGEAINERLVSQRRAGTIVGSLRRDEPGRTALLDALGQLYCSGHPVDWRRIYGPTTPMIELPSYPWQRQRCWLDDEYGRRRQTASGGHPLLESFVRSAIAPAAHHWCATVSTEHFPYLRDHQIEGTAVMPASLVLDAALAAARAASGTPATGAPATGAPGPVVEDLELTRMTVVADTAEDPTLQIVCIPETADGGSLRVFSRDGRDGGAHDWVQMARGRFRVPSHPDGEEHAGDDLAAARERCSVSMDPSGHYAALSGAGMGYGPAFQGVERLWAGDGEAVARLHPLADLTRDADPYLIHPVLLDSCLQVLAAALRPDEEHLSGTYLPVKIGRFRLFAEGRTPRWARAVAGEIRPEDRDVAGGRVVLFDEGGNRMAEVAGITLRRLEPTSRPDPVSDSLFEIHWQEVPDSAEADSAEEASSVNTNAGWWLLLADGGGVCTRLPEALASRGVSCVRVTVADRYRRLSESEFEVDPTRPEDFVKLLTELQSTHPTACAGVAHAWSLDASLTSDGGSLRTAQDLGPVAVLHLVQALARAGADRPPRLVLFTSGAQAVGEGSTPTAVAQSPLWGLARVLTIEHGELRPRIIDLDPDRSADQVDTLLVEMLRPGSDDQVALRAGKRYRPVLAPWTPPVALAAATTRRRFTPETGNFRLLATRPGILDSLALTSCERQRPGPGQVEIEVSAAGVNFSDVLKALGAYPGAPPGAIALGAECAGLVSAVGDGVTGIGVGDEVIAIAPASLAAFTTTAAKLVVPKPATLSYEQAASVPVAFLTAVYALEHLAALRAGERVLIHSATGGVGLAALQVARRRGAEVYATAGTEEKRDLLRTLGVSHVMDSRSLRFADEVMKLTDGRGVDVVLNSLAGEALTRSLSVLASRGRFIEIGKQDVYRNSYVGLEFFKHNRSLFVVDMERCFAEQPDLMERMLARIGRELAEGDYSPLPVRSFALTDADAAIATMAKARHTGKIVLRRVGQEMVAVPAEGPVRADATYLITGGLGALGLEMAKYLVGRGARHLVLMGRRAPAPAAAEVLAELRAQATVEVRAGDVSRYEDVAAVMSEIDESPLPLRGVVHAAGNLDDGAMLQFDQDRLRSVCAPKVDGSWHLHRATLGRELDFFVMYSSAASLLGSPGQGSYSAANAFLDSLAHHRRALGLPALSINWGPWADIGLAARPDRAGELAGRGVTSLRSQDGVEALGRLLPTSVAQVAVLPLDRDRLRLAAGTGLVPRLLSDLVADAPGQATAWQRSTGELRQRLLAVEPGARRRDLLVQHCRSEIARVLKLEEGQVDPAAPLASMGFDSLTSLELRKRLETTLDVELPATLAWRCPNVDALVPFLADRMEIALHVGTDDGLDTAADHPGHMPPPATGGVGDPVGTADVDELSDSDVEALLLAKVQTIEGAR